jgi:hypothetical protein
MDYTLNRVEVDVLALEQQIKSLEGVRVALESQALTLNVALEGDALMTDKNPWYGSLVGMHFDTKRPAKDYQMALEGVVDTVWEKIKAFFAKIVEYLKRFWAWLTGQHNNLTPEKVGSAETLAKKTADEIVKAVGTVKHLEVHVKAKDGSEAHVVATEDAGPRSMKPADLLNSVALSHKDHFISGLSAAEKLIIFSPAYTQGLEKLAREFARLKPVDALIKKYEHLTIWLNSSLAQARQVDGVTDHALYQQKFEHFKEHFESDAPGEGDDNILTGDIDNFYMARNGKGGEEFALEIPETGDGFVSLASQSDTCFRTVKGIYPEVKAATDGVQRLQGLFEGLGGKIDELAKAKPTGNRAAHDLVLTTLQRHVQQVTVHIQTIIKGLATFPAYFKDAHAAVLKYHRFVLNVLGDTVKQLTGEYEFREELIKSALAHARDAANAFARLE